MATILGQAFVSWLVQKVNKSVAELTIAIGRDSRLSGQTLMQAVIAGITSVGSPGYDFEMASTPAKSLSIHEQFLEEAQYCSNTVLAACNIISGYTGMRLTVDSQRREQSTP
jgi:hypothetical protein